MIKIIAFAFIYTSLSFLFSSVSFANNPTVEISESDANLLNAKLDEASNLIMPYIFLSDRNPKKAESKDLEKAIKLYDEVLDRIPNHWTSMFFKGKALQVLQRNEEAYLSFKQAFAIEKENKDVLNEYAVEAMQLGYFQEAYQALKTGKGKHPSDIGVRGNYALASVMVGRVDQSLIELRAVEARWPEDSITKTLIPIVEKIQSGSAQQPKTVNELFAMK